MLLPLPLLLQFVITVVVATDSRSSSIIDGVAAILLSALQAKSWIRIECVQQKD